MSTRSDIGHMSECVVVASHGHGMQGSLLDAAGPLALRQLATGLQRTVLTRGAWVDVPPGLAGRR